MRGLPKALYCYKKMDQFVLIMRVGLDSRSRPPAENCIAAIAIEENTSDSKSTKIVKFLLLDFHYVCVEGLALAHQKPH